MGITEYMTPGEFIGGILKHKRCDFVVNEIDLAGNIIEYDRNQQEISAIEQPKISSTGISDEICSKLTDEVGLEVSESIRNLVDEINAGNPDAILEIPCGDSKESRTKIHQAIKKFAPGLGSSTDLDAKLIKVYNGNMSNNSRKRKKFGIDARALAKPPSEFIEFTLWKENIETMAAIKQIARQLGTKDKYFGIAGNKDKRGVTTQRVTIFSTLLNSLKTTNFGDNIKVGSFKYADKQLKLGDLRGNLFTLVMRDIKNVPSDILNSRLNDLKYNGFINYFGLQRFGKSIESPTHLIGLAIIKSDYRKAVNYILAPRECKDPGERKARETWSLNHNVEEVLDLFPKFCVIFKQYVEKNILLGMKKAGGNETFLNGIMSLPRNSRTLYGHAYQSYIWNKATTQRLAFSKVPSNFYLVIGDLVLNSEGEPKVITEDDIHNYTIHDIVLPLPGAKVEMPRNETAEIYQKIFDEDQVSIEHFTEKYK